MFELIISDIMVKYNLDQTIDDFVNQELDKVLNEKLIIRNSEQKNRKNYINQFDNVLFMKICFTISTLWISYSNFLLENKKINKLDIVI